jgi:protocatechuate 3,4-dioxygenase beta subunit
MDLFPVVKSRHGVSQPRRPRRKLELALEELEGRIVPTLLNQQLFPLNYPWNQNIANAPLAANSAAIINQIGTSIHLTPNWYADDPTSSSPLYGMPFNIVHGNTTAKISVIIDNYPGESDLVPVPIPQNAVLEGDYQNGPNPNGGGYNPNQRGDSHLIVWDEDANTSYELFGVTRPSDPTLFPNTSSVELPHTDGLWHAAQETVWNMSTDTFRTLGETSADAAGLSILAGLARPDEGLTVAQGGQGVINHALRVTLPSGDLNPQYIYPASHMISVSQGPDNVPLGTRLRLANTPAIDALIANMPPESQILATAMQQYGLVVADVGSAMYVSGASATIDTVDTPNLNLTWDLTDIFAGNGLESLTAGDFEVVNLTPVVTGLSAASGSAGNTILVNGQNFSGAAGNLSAYFGTTASSSVTVLSDTQLAVVVPNGSGTVDVTVQSGVNEIDNISSNPNVNVNAPIFGYGTSAQTPADQFTYAAVTTSISGTVFNDLNGDGIQQAGEPGLQGWTVQLLNSSNSVVGSALTDVNGNYTITNVASGAYTVQEVLQVGYVQTDPEAPGTYSVTASGTNITGINFGDFQRVSVSGNVFNDLNGDGIQETGEPGLQGWTVQLIDSHNNVAGSVQTDANGNYSIANVGPGAYTVQEVLQPGCVQTAPALPGSYALTTTSGANVSGDNFGDFQQVSIGGNAFNDLNGDGVQETGEPGLQGWTVQLLDNHNHVAGSAQTDASGNYAVTGVGPGTFTVAQVMQSNWVQTLPLYPTAYTVTTTSGQNVSSQNFGDHSATLLVPLQTIDNGQAGFSTTGTWTSQNGGFNGTNQYAATTKGSKNTSTATWDFTGLASGSYDVWITYWGNSAYATNAPYSAYDGSTSITTKTINQSILVTQSHVGRHQESYGGVGWLELGTFSISNELKVVLGNKAKNQDVDADGVLIIKHSGISPALGQSVLYIEPNTDSSPSAGTSIELRTNPALELSNALSSNLESSDTLRTRQRHTQPTAWMKRPSSHNEIDSLFALGFDVHNHLRAF